MLDLKDKSPNEQVTLIISKMVERETKGNGDQINAIERVARRCRLTPSAVRRLAAGQTKNISASTYGVVRQAYREHLDEMILDLTAEREAELSLFHIPDALSLSDEIDALRAKLEATRNALKEKRNDDSR